MMEMKVLQLNKGAEKRLKQGHLWVYSNEVDVKATPLKLFAPGEQVIVKDHTGREMGVVMMSPASLICGRLVSRDPKQKMDQSLLVHRMKIALSLRELAFDSPHYRLVFGDSDALPGLVVDRFGDVLVVQISSVGMEILKDDVIAALEKVCKPKTILFKNNGKMRAPEALESYVKVVFGE
ncbi:MAG: 23S rRNA (cytosine1962-C5)-methyltransferase, partial [Oleiphilaceae bacterium]